MWRIQKFRFRFTEVFNFKVGKNENSLFVIAFFASAALCAQPFSFEGNSYVQREFWNMAERNSDYGVCEIFRLSSETAIVVDSSMGNLAKFVLGSDGSENALKFRKLFLKG
ncbi:MAG: hypothetical protein ACLUKN_16220 [Bacilli bacterium]